MKNKAGKEMRCQVLGQVWNQAGRQVRGQVWIRARVQVWDQVWDQVAGQVNDQVILPLRNHLQEQNR